jgi:hypothetical protein
VLACWTAVAAAVAFFLGQALFPGAGLYTTALSPAAINWIGALLKLAFLALAVLWGLQVCRRFDAGNPVRLAWGLWTSGLLGFLVGQLILTVYLILLGKTTVFPSLADLFFVPGSLALIASLVAFLRAYHQAGFPAGGRAERWTIGLGAAALAAAIVVPILRPVLLAPAPPLEKLLNVLYPSLDFLMLIPALLLLRMGFRFWGGKVGLIWLALVCGILLTAAGDLLFGYFSGLGQTQVEALLDVLYIAAYGCFALAVLYQGELLRIRRPAPVPA